MILCLGTTQVRLAARAGARVLQQIVTIYENYDLETQVLTASIRGALHVLQ